MGSLIYITDSKIIDGNSIPVRLSLGTLNWLMSNLGEDENLYIGISMSVPVGSLVNGNIDNQIAE